MGLLALNGRDPFYFDSDDLDLLEGIIAQAAVAVGNARLFAEGERRLRTVEALAVVGLDALTDPGIALTAEARARIEQSDYRTVLAIPLLVLGRPIGVLTVGDRAGRVFDDEAVRIAQVFADQAAIVMEHTSLLE